MPVNLVVGENSYVDVAEADEYFAGRLDADAWEGSDTDTKAKALITATRRIDMQRLRGKKADPKQKLQFPRCYWEPLRQVESNRSNADDPFSGGWWCEGEVPQQVKDACCEEALFLLQMTAWDKKRERQQALGVTGQAIGDANELYDSAVVRVRALEGRRLHSPEARRLLAGYIIGAVPIV